MSSDSQPELKSADPGATPVERVRYVEVQQSTGWQTMARAVREIDVEKIQDCKEDIDTLLVFAGLYSAVLSAFLIESYTNLLPDTTSQTIYLLQRIANQTQSYTLAAGHLNTTAAPSDAPPNDIPAWAMNVNALWFASLIISLSVASYGMLVKQWLREYLAMEWTAPRERLRARQYRKPSLDRWRVFEIAAALPLLLQVSLGLFFAGLCVFTANVNDRISRATIALVCAWAAFFVFATLAPFVTPRCPYKTPFLKGTLRAGRTYLTRPLLYVAETLREFLFSKLGRYKRFINSGIVMKMSREEEDLISRDEDDAAILVSTDRYTADDNFLPVMIETYKQYTQATPQGTICFIIDLISNRLGGDRLQSPLVSLPSLLLLSKKAYTVLLDAVATTITSFSGSISLAEHPWQKDAWLLLLSSSYHPPPHTALEARRRLLSGDPLGITLRWSGELQAAYIRRAWRDIQWSDIVRSVPVMTAYIETHADSHAIDPIVDQLSKDIVRSATVHDGCPTEDEIQITKEGWESTQASPVFLAASCEASGTFQGLCYVHQLFNTIYKSPRESARLAFLRNLIRFVQSLSYEPADAVTGLRTLRLVLQLYDTEHSAHSTSAPAEPDDTHTLLWTQLWDACAARMAAAPSITLGWRRCQCATLADICLRRIARLQDAPGAGLPAHIADGLAFVLGPYAALKRGCPARMLEVVRRREGALTPAEVEALGVQDLWMDVHERGSQVQVVDAGRGSMAHDVAGVEGAGPHSR